ncbi:helix-turn-helix domain-containing protein [Cellulomonas endophytica]|uniref:helix-turn-helix domain-containing protein n=1 Tax=Cellulomonas endophytica TaxID=2494735 RepID=UPI0013E90B5A|nr:helix-turn-helix transcriptional regulator [Cellulomonas endophytica]
MAAEVELAQRLRAARRSAGMSQTELAGADLSPSYVSLLEAGKREPSEATLVLLASRLGTSVEYLREGEHGPDETRARLALARARLALGDGDPSGALAHLADVEVAAVSPGLRRQALATLAAAHETAGDLVGSVAVLEPLVAEARQQGRRLEGARLSAALATVYLRAGDTYRAVEVAELAALDLEDAQLTASDEHLRLVATVVQGYAERGDLAYAAHRAGQLVRVADDQECPRVRARVYELAATVAQERGETAAAAAYVERALAVVDEGVLNAELATLRLVWARLLLRDPRSDPRTALDQVERAWPSVQARGTREEQARVDLDRSAACLRLDEVDGATRWALSALARLDGGRGLVMVHAQLALADALHASGDGVGAVRAVDAAAELLDAIAPSRRTAAAWREVGDRLRRVGDGSGTVRAYDRALRDAGFPSAVPLPTVPRARVR